MTLSSKGIQALLLTNIITLIGVAVTLVWASATVVARFEVAETELARVRAVQSTLVIDQEAVKTELSKEREARLLMDGRLFRLEDRQMTR